MFGILFWVAAGVIGCVVVGFAWGLITPSRWRKG